MKKTFLSFLLACLSSMILFSQDINYQLNLKAGKVDLTENKGVLKRVNDADLLTGRVYAIVQFYQFPDEKTKTELEKTGFLLGDYLPQRAYYASFPKDFDFNILKTYGIRSLSLIKPEWKLSPLLSERPFPDYALKGDKIILVINYFKNLSQEEVKKELEAKNIEIIALPSHTQSAYITVSESEINDIAKLPFVTFVELPSPPGKAESEIGRGIHRSNVIGRLYDGTGIKVGVFDDGFVGPHIDFKGRTEQSDVINSLVGTHGDGVSGVIGSAGNLNPQNTGMAPGAFLHIYEYGNSNLTGTAVDWFTNDGVLIFNASYSDGCNQGYTAAAQTVDASMFANPTMLQTFSAGNNGTQNCSYGAGSGWGNITGGHKQSKNSIAVANLNELEGLEASSSRGPAQDGRLKPDISAHGQNQVSNDPDNGYQSFGGTSAAAPGIAGVSAQLYEAYKTLNAGATPEAALIKASLLNSADDMGNVGPDFKYGWGRVNSRRAYQILVNGMYQQGVVSQNSNNTHSIGVPSGISELRVMIYWSDPSAAVGAGTALVNDLDLTLSTPSGATLLPWLLDPTPNAVNLAAPATHGADHLNNMEQVLITNPTPGAYTINVNGFGIPQGPQSYWVVYSFIENEITVTYPLGGEGFVPGEKETVCWDAPVGTSTFDLDYTADGGATWIPVTTGLAASKRQYVWTIPNTVTGDARIRVTAGSMSAASAADFSIVGMVAGIGVDSVCANDVFLSWDAVTGATGYDVFRLGNNYMDSVATTNTTNAVVTIPVVGAEEWFAVRPKGANGLVGRRTNAFRYSGDCTVSCLGVEDAGVDAIFPSGDLLDCSGGVTPVIVILENLGPNPQTGFTVSYQLDGGATVNENFNGTLPGNSTFAYTFNQNLTALAAGNHHLKIWTALAGDITVCNDTLETDFHFYSGTPATLPFQEDFQSANFPPNNWRINNPDGSYTWEQSATITGADGAATKAATLDFWSYSTLEEKDKLSSYIIDLQNAALPTLYFDVAYAPYSAVTNDSLLVRVSSDCGQTFNVLYAKGGTSLQTQPNSTTAFIPNAASDWRRDTVDLQAFIGQQIIVEFVTVNHYGNHLYLDNINVLNLAVAPTAAFIADFQSPCPLQTVSFKDNSTFNPSAWQWTFTPNTVTFVNGTSATSQNPEVRFNTAGNYNVTLQATNGFGSDTEVQNAYINASVGATLPLTENFDAYTNCGTAPGCESVVCDINGWQNVRYNQSEQIDWRVNSGPTPSVASGPDVDHTLGNTTGKYIYLESGSSQEQCYGKTAHLVSSCITVTGLQTPALTFWYHLYGSGMGSLSVDIFSNGAWTNDIWTKSGNQGNSWKFAEVNLSSYIGQTVLLRFRGVTGNTQTGDMAIDDIGITDITGIIQTPKQYGLSLLPNPTNGETLLEIGEAPQGEYTVSLMDMAGRTLMQNTAQHNGGYFNRTLSVNDLSVGVYTVRVKAGERLYQSRLLVLD